MLTTISTLFATPDSWTSGANARDINGNPVPACNQAAVSWDVQGYLLKLQFQENGRDFTELNKAYKFLTMMIPTKNKDIELYNDIIGDHSSVADWVLKSSLPAVFMSADITDGTELSTATIETS